MYTIIVTFDSAKDAEKFRRFVNRRTGGTAYRRENRVIIRPATPDEVRSWFAMSGYVGDVLVTDISNVPR